MAILIDRHSDIDKRDVYRYSDIYIYIYVEGYRYGDIDIAILIAL